MEWKYKTKSKERWVHTHISCGVDSSSIFPNLDKNLRKFLLQSFFFNFFLIWYQSYSLLYHLFFFHFFSSPLSNGSRRQPKCQQWQSSGCGLIKYVINGRFWKSFLSAYGDHLGLVLVSNHLIGSNYNTWSHLMLMALTTKNKTGFIGGSITQPAFDHLLFDVWTRCNSMAISWILNVIFREIADRYIIHRQCF